MLKAIIVVIAAAILIISVSGIYHQYVVYQDKVETIKENIVEAEKEVQIAQQEYDLATQRVNMMSNR